LPKRRIALPPIDDLKTWRAVYVTPRQLAEYWMVHLDSIKRWLRTGQLRGTRIGENWRIRADDARLFELRLFAPRNKAS
jgi:excisionase family DNA binding protein